jgi:hypothetical protein
MNGGTTLLEAQEWLRERVDHGAACPCCTQFAKVYRRKIHSTMARDLLITYREAGQEWFHLPSLLASRAGVRPGQGGDFCKLAYWGLIEEDDAVRDDGSTRSGWWRITDLGDQFVRNRLAVPKYARIYDGRCMGLVDESMATIRDALGSKFNYDDLMQGI